MSNTTVAVLLIVGVTAVIGFTCGPLAVVAVWAIVLISILPPKRY